MTINRQNTKKTAESIVDAAFYHWLYWLVTLWTGRQYFERERPPLWVRRLILITFPVSYVILAALFVATMCAMFVILVPLGTILGIRNFYARRWND